MQQRNPLHIRQMIIQQGNRGLRTGQSSFSCHEFARQPYLLKAGNMADIFCVHLRQQRFILNDPIGLMVLSSFFTRKGKNKVPRDRVFSVMTPPQRPT